MSQMVEGRAWVLSLPPRARKQSLHTVLDDSAISERAHKGPIDGCMPAMVSTRDPNVRERPTAELSACDGGSTIA